MPRNGSGIYTPIAPDNPVASGNLIEAGKFNNTVNDISDAITGSIAKNGETTATGNIPMGTFRLTGLGNGSARSDSAALGQVQDQAGTWCGTAGGTANAITLTPVPAITAYVAGQKFGFIALATNAGPVTIAVSGLATKAGQNYEAALAAGELVIGHQYEITYDGTAFQFSAAGSSYARLADFTWTTPAFNSADFTASGGMAWTVETGDVATLAYLIIGKTMIINFHITATTVSGTPGTTLRIKIPAAKSSAKRIACPFTAYDNGTNVTGMALCALGSTNIELTKNFDASSNWTSSTNNTYVTGSITFEIQ